MNSSNNLIVALLALWCYAHNSNINLANNATFLLILYALLNRSNQCAGNQPRPVPFAGGNNGGPSNGFNGQPPFGGPFPQNGFGQPGFSSTPFPNTGFGPTFF